MFSADEKLRSMISGEFTKDDLTVINELLGSVSRPASVLLTLAERGYDRGVFTLYEAFQLAVCYYSHKRRIYESLPDLLTGMDMALISKLFGEEGLYKAFSADCIRIRNNMLAHYREYCQKQGKPDTGKLDDFLLDDIEGFLSADREHMELLSSRNHRIRGEGGTEKFSFFRFPYEDEFLKIYNGEIERYPIDKNMSDIVCDIIATVEIGIQ